MADFDRRVRPGTLLPDSCCLGVRPVEAAAWRAEWNLPHAVFTATMVPWASKTAMWAASASKAACGSASRAGVVPARLAVTCALTVSSACRVTERPSTTSAGRGGGTRGGSLTCWTRVVSRWRSQARCCRRSGEPDECSGSCIGPDDHFLRTAHRTHLEKRSPISGGSIRRRSFLEGPVTKRSCLACPGCRHHRAGHHYLVVAQPPEIAQAHGDSGGMRNFCPG
jgi:hypothetical protein